VPPLLLIFLVLGTIFLGIATPTEGGAMGAAGALILAIARQRLSWKLLKQAMETTGKLSSFVIFILVGSTVFGWFSGRSTATCGSSTCSSRCRAARWAS
jgi:TRAP-type mannitol/chloroaromatic compound transport system permease large subunit